MRIVKAVEEEQNNAFRNREQSKSNQEMTEGAWRQSMQLTARGILRRIYVASGTNRRSRSSHRLDIFEDMAAINAMGPK